MTAGKDNVVRIADEVDEDILVSAKRGRRSALRFRLRRHLTPSRVINRTIEVQNLSIAISS